MSVSTAVVALLAAHVVAPPDPVTIQAELKGPYFYVNAEANGKPLRLAVDSGAGMNLLTPAAADRLGIKGGTPVNANGVGNSSVAAKIVDMESLKIGNATQNHPQAVVIALPEVLEVDGLVGYGFFSTFVTTLDYEKQQMTFTPPSEFKAPAGYIETPLRVRGNIPEVQMTVDGVEGWVKVDSGASDALTLFDDFVESRELRERLPDVREVLGMMGVGGGAAADEAKMKGLILAGFELPDMMISMSKQKKGAFADKEAIGNLGGDILRRFTVILDYTHGKAYFKKNKNFDVPQLYNRTGIALLYAAKQHKVIGVRPGSVGEKSGVVVGETILAVNGTPVEKLHPLDVWAALRAPAGTKVKLKIRNKQGKERDTDLTLADS